MKRALFVITGALVALAVAVPAAAAQKPSTDTAGAPSGLGVQPVYHESNRSCQSFKPSPELVEFKADVPGRNITPGDVFDNGTFDLEEGPPTRTGRSS